MACPKSDGASPSSVLGLAAKEGRRCVAPRAHQLWGGVREVGLGEQAKRIPKCFAARGAGHARGIPG